ncbi:MAG: chorismate mutase [bacterium]
MNTQCRGIRGAITVEKNVKTLIMSATNELLKDMLDKNNIQPDDIVSIFFSITRDLDKAFPAAAAREQGLTHTPLLCLNEIEVEGSLKKCIRILLHINTTKHQKDLRHSYLKGAKILRPDLQ